MSDTYKTFQKARKDLEQYSFLPCVDYITYGIELSNLDIINNFFYRDVGSFEDKRMKDYLIKL